MKLRVSSFKLRAQRRGVAESPSRHPSHATCHLLAFTLIELLTVIAIIGILAAIATPIIKHFSKGDVTVSATRQMLDDCARARQLAMSRRTTVFMVFIPTNFWTDSLNPIVGQNEWTPVHNFAPLIEASTTVTQMYAAQWNGYFMTSLRTIGDQPGRDNPQDLVRVRTLPSGSFIAPFKFTAPLYNPLTPSAPVPYPLNRNDLLIYGFPRTNTIPFPTCDLLTNTPYMTQKARQGFPFVTLPYIAFNYLGQLTPGDGSVLPYDENIPLSYGSILEPLGASSKVPFRGLPNAQENPPGDSTNIAFNVIHIDHLTGRARLEQQDVQ